MKILFKTGEKLPNQKKKEKIKMLTAEQETRSHVQAASPAAK